MLVNIEFLDDEPIENVITCLNYKIDKVIFFGYAEVIEKQRKNTERFLKQNCGVEQLEFCSLSHTNLESVVDTMRKQIEHETKAGNKVFFDITGGENLILVAFGMLSQEMKMPMHMYDVESGKLIELNSKVTAPISKAVPKQFVRLNLDSYIKMQGGVINYRMHKSVKSEDDSVFNQLIPAIWTVSNRNAAEWNAFSAFLKQYGNPAEGLVVNASAATVIAHLRQNKVLNTVQSLNRILDECADADILEDVKHKEGQYHFKYRNEAVKNCLLDAGSILELHTYHQEKNHYNDCRVGVHLDWDGVIQDKYTADVLNEVDVLALDGYVSTFMSVSYTH